MNILLRKYADVEQIHVIGFEFMELNPDVVMQSLLVAHDAVKEGRAREFVRQILGELVAERDFDLLHRLLVDHDVCGVVVGDPPAAPVTE